MFFHTSLTYILISLRIWPTSIVYYSDDSPKHEKTIDYRQSDEEKVMEAIERHDVFRRGGESTLSRSKPLILEPLKISGLL
jgi:hypothetical protein